MQTAFVIFALAGCIYFLFSKRKFDYYSIAYLSSIIYFMPGFFGVTSYHINGNWSDSGINNECYYIYIVVTTTTLVFSLLSSFIPKLKSRIVATSSTNLLPALALFLAVIGATGLITTAGSSLSSPDKHYVMENIGRWHILFYSAATIGLPIAFVLKRYYLAILFFLMLLFDLYIGFRGAAAISVLSVVVVHLNNKGATRLVFQDKRLVAIVAIFAIVMFGYKPLETAIKANRWDFVAEQLGNPDIYIAMFTQSEPFIVQQTLNDIVSSNFHTTSDSLISALYQLISFAPELGAEDVKFSTQFQNRLYPDLDYGLGANIWAQMWSIGGWALLFPFILFYNLVLAIGNLVLRSSNLAIRAGSAPIFCYWAFYLHRNELSYAILIEKRHLLLLTAIIILAALIGAAKSIKLHRPNNSQSSDPNTT